MKILICTGIYPPDIGGPATYSKLLFNELPKRGIKVEVLTFGEVRKYPKIFRHFLYFLKTLKKARNVDLIYAQDPVSVGYPACLVAKILGKKFVLKVVGDYAWEQQQQIKGASFISLEDFQDKKFDLLTEIRRKIERRVAKKADKVVVPSYYLKKIVKLWGVSDQVISVVYNSFASRKITESKKELRQRFSFENKVIFSVGRLVPWKGFSLLIEIMKDFPDLDLLIAGDGPDKKKLEKKIIDLNLLNRVKLLGKIQQEKLLKKIKASDIFVLNTGYEGFSHQLLEVMSVGTPIITTAVGGNLELLENRKEGLLVQFNDKDSLKKAINELISEKETRTFLIENARQKVQKFNEKKMLKEIGQILKKIIA